LSIDLFCCFAIVELFFVCPLEQPKKNILVKNVVRIESFIKIAAYVEAFVFVAEFEIRQHGTNANAKYKSSLLIP
jgi:hypothetical protein